MFMCSATDDIISRTVHDVVDSTPVSVTPSTSLSFWTRSEVAAASWRAAGAAQAPTHRVLSPVVDGQSGAVVEEDSDVVDRATLPRVGKRSPSSHIVSLQPQYFNVRILLLLLYKSYTRYKIDRRTDRQTENKHKTTHYR